MRYWIGVSSKEHVMSGVKGGFAQVCHGKEGPLKQMQPMEMNTAMRGISH